MIDPGKAVKQSTEKPAPLVATAPKLLAGVIFGLAFGARLAGGCTSGHGISGTMQLNVASWIAVICFFIGGIAVAMTLFKL